MKNIQEINANLQSKLPTLKNGNIDTRSRWVKMTIELLEKGTVRTIVSSGSSWSHSSLHDESITITNFLNNNNIAFEKGNDAPKGGKLGNFIKLK